MAAGQNPEAEMSPFQLLPSDIAGIDDASEYAKERGDELKKLTVKVQKMGMLGAFVDSKISNKDKGVFSISFKRSDKGKIKEEIIKYLSFFNNMLKSIEKVDDEEKAVEEKENPYIVIIDLNKKLTDLFEMAHSGMDTSTSRTVSKLYKNFLDQQKDLENKMKKMECVFLKQQLLAESRRRHAYSSSVQKLAEGGIAHKDQYFSYMTEEVENLRQKNKDLEQLVEVTSQKMEILTQHFQNLYQSE